MWTISEIKRRGKDAFQGNYWYCVLVSVILAMCAGGAGGSTSSSSMDPEKTEQLKEMIASVNPMVIAGILGVIGVAAIVGVALDIFLFNPLLVGCYAFFSRNVRNTPASLNEIKEGFAGYGSKVLAMFLKDLFIFLWTLLLIIPGIVKSYSYKMVPYILADNPDISAMDAITKSREMMNGNKMKAFLLDLSFFGWILLSAFTCGIVALFYVGPYIASTQGALYEELKNQGNNYAG